MFDIGMFEMVLIGVIALLILGPERMPEAARAAGRWAGKARRFITGIKQDVSSQMSMDELTELRSLRDDLATAKTELNKFQQDANSTLNEEIKMAEPTDKKSEVAASTPAKDSTSKS
jgi:sec-independent protein translocase protein TatB